LNFIRVEVQSAFSEFFFLVVVGLFCVCKCFSGCFLGVCFLFSCGCGCFVCTSRLDGCVFAFVSGLGCGLGFVWLWLWLWGLFLMLVVAACGCTGKFFMLVVTACGWLWMGRWPLLELNCLCWVFF